MRGAAGGERNERKLPGKTTTGRNATHRAVVNGHVRREGLDLRDEGVAARAVGALKVVGDIPDVQHDVHRAAARVSVEQRQRLVAVHRDAHVAIDCQHGVAAAGAPRAAVDRVQRKGEGR